MAVLAFAVDGIALGIRWPEFLASGTRHEYALGESAT